MILGILGTIVILYTIAVTIIARQQYKLAQSLEDMYVDVLDRVYVTLLEMRRLDDKQMFEKDDEVGEVFESLSLILKKNLSMESDQSNENAYATSGRIEAN